MPASLQEKKNPDRIIQALDKVALPRSTLSARALDSFAQKRPDYIAPDYQTGKGYERLVRNLSYFNKELTSAFDNHVKKTRAEDHAQALIAYDKYNGQDIDELAKSNPEIAEQMKKNYYFKEGYEKARLNTLGLSKAKFMQDEYTHSGLQNETDINKVIEWANKTSAEWDKTHEEELSKMNPLMVAEAYAPYAEKAKSGLLSRHTQDIAASWETRSLEAEQSKALALAENIVPDLDNPNIEREALSALTRIVHNMGGNMRANGVREDKIVSEIADTVFGLYAKYDEDMDVLDILETPLDNGVIPANIPEIATRISQLQEASADKAYKRQIQQAQLAKLQREETLRTFEDTLALNVINNQIGGITFDTPLDNNGTSMRMAVNQGFISPKLAVDLIKSSNEMLEIFNKQYEATPELVVLNKSYEMRALYGEFDYTMAIELAKETRNPTIIENFYKGNKDRDEELIKVANKYRSLLRTDIAGDEDQESLYVNGKPSTLLLNIIEAQNRFSEEFYRAVKEWEKLKNRGADSFIKDSIARAIYDKLSGIKPN